MFVQGPVLQIKINMLWITFPATQSLTIVITISGTTMAVINSLIQSISFQSRDVHVHIKGGVCTVCPIANMDKTSRIFHAGGADNNLTNAVYSS